ncbi:MAG TPA: tetratricopeptide repeat protein [Stellaceae bacterium]|nr:tetratricopeptide repeat protein [Stellaceae bacterium]
MGGLRSGCRLVSALALALLAASCASTDAQDPAPATPQSALGSYLAAEHAQVVHDYGDAANFLERALAADPDNYDLVRHAFLLRVSEGHIAESVPLAQRIVDVDGRSGLPGLVLLEQQLKAGKYGEVVKDAQSMPHEGAQRFSVPLMLAWAQAGEGQFGPALQTLDGMNGANGIAPLHDLHTALIDDFTDHIDEAVAAYQKVTGGTQPPTWRVAELAGNFLERHDRAEEAKRLYERVGKATVDVAPMGLARIAKGIIPPRVIASPADGAAEGLFDLAGLLNEPATTDAALVYARLALDLSPHFALAQMLVAEIRDGQDRAAEALALYEAVDPQSPYAWMAQLRAALELDTLGRTDEAMSRLKALAAARPTQAEPLVELGDILRSHERFPEAVAAYNDAVARTPHPAVDDWRLFYSRGVAEERAGDWPRAEADLKKALQLQPDQPLVLNYLGYSWIDKGENLTEALGMIKRAVDLSPNDGYIVDSLGWAYFHLKDFAHATQYLERAIELLPEDPTINDHLGDAYWRDGRIAEARYQWKRALQFQPEANEAKGIETKLDRGLGTQAPAAVSGG